MELQNSPSGYVQIEDERAVKPCNMEKGKTPHVDSRFERVRNLSTQSISHSGCMHSLQMNDLNASGEFSESKV